MPFGRLAYRLLVAIPAILGIAAGAGPLGAGLVSAEQGPARQVTAASVPGAPLAAADVPTLRTPGQSLPVPVHNEATCAFCQAAIFSPCAPQPTGVSIEATCLVRHERAAPQAAQPHSTSHRPTRSRAPPPLRSA